jgi:dissimilatory sulfite reductase (desulfoviridin) alpha/beta subunit
MVFGLPYTSDALSAVLQVIASTCIIIGAFLGGATQAVFEKGLAKALIHVGGKLEQMPAYMKNIIDVVSNEYKAYKMIDTIR